MQLMSSTNRLLQCHRQTYQGRKENNAALASRQRVRIRHFEKSSPALRVPCRSRAQHTLWGGHKMLSGLLLQICQKIE